jgi:hypothetical protein
MSKPKKHIRIIRSLCNELKESNPSSPTLAEAEEYLRAEGALSPIPIDAAPEPRRRPMPKRERFYWLLKHWTEYRHAMDHRGFMRAFALKCRRACYSPATGIGDIEARLVQSYKEVESMVEADRAWQRQNANA